MRSLLGPLVEHGYVHKQYHAKILSALPDMLALHEELLTELNTAFNSKRRGESLPGVLVGFLVQRRQTLLALYTKFKDDYGDMLDLFGTTFHGNKLLDQFLKRMEKEKGLKLLSYLRFPMVRIKGYVMLLEELRSVAHIDGLDVVLEAVSS